MFVIVEQPPTNIHFHLPRPFCPLKGTVHHMALAGCLERPKRTKFNLWNCGGKNGEPAFDPAFPIAPVCPGPSSRDPTIYLYGRGETCM